MSEKVVTLRESDHRYFDNHGKEYISWSKLIGMVSPKFEDTFASKNASDETKQEWRKKLFQKEMKIEPENEDLTNLVTSVASSYKHYARVYVEKVVWSEEFFVAGTADVISRKTSHKDSVVDFSDHKTNLTGISYESKYKNYLMGPLGHLQDCSYNKYALQLSMYAHLEQMKTGCKVGRLWINYFPGGDMENWKQLPVPFMKLEVQSLLEWYREQPKVVEVNVPSSNVYTGAAF